MHGLDYHNVVDEEYNRLRAAKQANRQADGQTDEVFNPRNPQNPFGFVFVLGPETPFYPNSNGYCALSATLFE